MKKRVRVIYLVASACWGLFAIGVLFLLLAYLTSGASLQIFGFPFSSGSVLLGVGHFIGIVAGFLVCTAISAGFFVKGTIRE